MARITNVQHFRDNYYWAESESEMLLIEEESLKDRVAFELASYDLTVRRYNFEYTNPKFHSMIMTNDSPEAQYLRNWPDFIIGVDYVDIFGETRLRAMSFLEVKIGQTVNRQEWKQLLKMSADGVDKIILVFGESDLGHTGMALPRYWGFLDEIRLIPGEFTVAQHDKNSSDFYLVEPLAGHDESWWALTFENKHDPCKSYREIDLKNLHPWSVSDFIKVMQKRSELWQATPQTSLKLKRAVPLAETADKEFPSDYILDGQFGKEGVKPEKC